MARQALARFRTVITTKPSEGIGKMMTEDSTPAPEGARGITRRGLFAAIPACGLAAIVPAVASAAEPKMTIREQAIWHMRELERLAIEDGAQSAMVTVVGRFWTPDFDCRTLMIDSSGTFIDFELEAGRPALFAEEGAAA